MKLAENVYEKFLQAGEKFTDADLMGIPWHIVCGREAKNGKVELKNRKTGERKIIVAKKVIKEFKAE